MSDPAGSGRRSSGRASNFFPHLLSEILSNMSGRSESSDIGSDPYDIGSDSYDIGSDPYDSDTLSWSAPVSDNREDDFDLFVDGNVSEGYYVALFLQQILSSGQVHMINSNSMEPRFRAKPPIIKQLPDLEKLQANSIYTSLRNLSGCASNLKPKSVMQLLAQRERGLSTSNSSLTRSERCSITNHYLPNHSSPLMKLDSKVYCGSLSNNGKFFVTASQDHELRIFDATTDSYELVNRMVAKDVSWGILDIAFTADSEYFVYSTWSSCLHLSKTSGGSTEELKALKMEPLNKQQFCIFSVAFTNCGRQIISGSSDGCLYVYDRELNARTSRVPVSQNVDNNHVNTVGFMDETSNIIFTGLEDGIIQIWDHRCLDESRLEPVGKLIGHYDGITFIDAKMDGRYLISNSKDQSIKLWDLRMFSPSGAKKQPMRFHKNSPNGSSSWDYRWDNVPNEFYNGVVPMKDDTSVMTYRGHRVKKSLIRAKFSPAETTGQRYIYTGCGTGRLIIYDTLTGKIEQSIEGHKDIVRDVAWHPHRTEVLTSSWDAMVNINKYLDRAQSYRFERKKRLPKRGPKKDDGEDRDTRTKPYSLRRSRRIANQRETNSTQ